MNSAAATVGQYLVETLAVNGIDTVFGIPGVHNIELYRGLEHSRVRHVLARHEQNAGFAADGYARVSGRPAAVFVISGPGLTNVVTAVAQAYSDSVPLLVIATTPVRASLGRHWGVLHELTDQRACIAGVTGFAGSALTTEQLREHLGQAFAALHAPRPRPAYIDIPLDLLAERTSLRAELFVSAAATAVVAPEALGAARRLLAAAARPLLIAGGGARHAGAGLKQLIEAVDGYVVTTVAGKGVIAESHPASLGASLPYAPVRELIAAADVVVAAGTELSETDTYMATRLTLGGPLVRIDVDPAKLSDPYAAQVRIAGDAAGAVAELARGATPRQGWRTAAGEAAAWRVKIESQFGSGGRARLVALEALRAALPSDGAVFSDMTQIAYLGNYAFRAERPGLWFHPCGYGALGFAVPAAIGAKIAQPQRAIVALAGDFGFQLTQQELMTAVELDLNVVVMLWNNGVLGQIRHDMRAAGVAPIGVVARNPDFVALAAACGASAARVRSPEQLSRELRLALQRPGPTLLDVAADEFAP